jgi:hypothetical protein
MTTKRIQKPLREQLMGISDEEASTKLGQGYLSQFLTGQGRSGQISYAEPLDFDEVAKIFSSSGIPVTAVDMYEKEINPKTGLPTGGYMPTKKPVLDPNYTKSQAIPDLEEHLSRERGMPTEVDLTPLNTLLQLRSNRSGQKMPEIQASKHTIDHKNDKLMSLQKMIQDEKDNEKKREIQMMQIIAQAARPKISMGGSINYPPSRGAGSGVDDRFTQRQVTALNKQLGPDKISKAKVKLRQAFNYVGGFDPTNSNEIAGVGGYGLGWLETVNPLDKDRRRAQKNRSVILDAIADARHAITGSALTGTELETAIEREGFTGWGDPSGLRRYLGTLAAQLDKKIEIDRAGYDDEVLSRYDSNPNAVRPGDFDVTRWGDPVDPDMPQPLGLAPNTPAQQGAVTAPTAGGQSKSLQERAAELLNKRKQK